ncbi:MAG: ShlB/FhaC/HecB family hemolysin secretion/activation protein [Gammaproteobacteria bacterium]|nr:ShlB/FhaC/HecB family hemolysin secretion/activation protein [Gammaproteobacteria bacterium]
MSWAQTAFEPVRFTVSGFVVTGDNPIGDRARKTLEPFLGEQYGLEGLSAAADALEQEIIQQGYSFHRVTLPPQQLTSGSVEFKVLRFAIGAVNIDGNQHFDDANILNSLPELSVGSTPNTKELSRSLKLANNHASKNMLLKFREGEAGDTIDAELTVQDRSPQIVFLTLDNTGNEDSEEIRSTVGYQHGNLFNRDHAMTATLTVAPEDPDATTQIGINYHIPLYRHGANLDFLLSDSEIDSGQVGEDIAVNGKGSVVGFSYRRPLLTDTNFDHHWAIGFQNKIFDNEFEVSGETFESDVASFPLELGYSFTYKTQSSSLSGGLGFASNIESGSDNTDDAYALARNGATTDWSALKYSLAYDRVFAGDWLFHISIGGQDSSDLLISGEQFGVGGSSSLRGFEERSVTGDSGYETTLEWWTPPWQGIRFLFFYDMANVELNEGEEYDLSSFGLGLRWSWQQQLSVTLDYAVINEGGGPDDTINQDDDDKAHFNLVYRF